jgi:hypothetical protein
MGKDGKCTYTLLQHSPSHMAATDLKMDPRWAAIFYSNLFLGELLVCKTKCVNILKLITDLVLNLDLLTLTPHLVLRTNSSPKSSILWGTVGSARIFQQYFRLK